MGEGLAQIASNNHVYGYAPDVFAIDREHGQLTPKLIGVREASTFSGFCGTHDTELFRAVETEPFTGELAQVGLLSFRCVAHELWEKRVKQRTHAVYRQVLVERQMLNRHTEYELAIMEEADRLDLARVEEVKAEFDRMVTTRNWAGLSGVILWRDKVPPVLAAGATYPQYDFAGEELQTFQPDTRVDTLAVSAVGVGGRTGAIVLAAPRAQNAGIELIDSLVNLLEAEIAEAAIRLIFEHVENHYMSPDWWNSLQPIEKQTVLIHTNSGLVPIRPRRPGWYDRSRKLPVGVGLRSVQRL